MLGDATFATQPCGACALGEHRMAEINAFGWRVQLVPEDFRFIGFGCNSMGAHTVMGMYSLFKSVQLCEREDCGFQEQVRGQIPYQVP